MASVRKQSTVNWLIIAFIRGQLTKSSISISYIEKFTSLLEELLGWVAAVRNCKMFLRGSYPGNAVTCAWLLRLKLKLCSRLCKEHQAFLR